MYHSVADTDDDPYDVTVSPARLDRQLAWLAGRGLRGVSMAELRAARGTRAARRMVALTFDDGYADLLTGALPVLARHGCTATAFVLAGRFGGSNEWDRPGPAKPLMTRAQILEAEAAGVEIGSHGLRHVRLTRVPPAEMAHEVAHSREVLADLLGHEVAGFCYPYGDLGAAVIAAVRDAGYAYAAATDTGDPAEAYAVPRVFVGGRDGPWRLRAKHLRRRLRGR
jgi:peptidoglycan/xylan/chitin deacetylase (PgdA/CDA1 family)